MSDLPIGIFDSGIGGLTVLKEIRKLLPNEDIIYFGDTARVPYGNKSPKLVQRFSLEITKFLEQIGVKMIVVACNTASSLALEFLKKHTNIPVIGVIDPGVRAAITITEEKFIKAKNKDFIDNVNNLKNNKMFRKVIGIIGTKATIKSESYQSRIKSINSEYVVLAKACPLFVPIVEENLIETEIAEKAIEYYLSEFKFNEPKPSTIILACTHYPILKQKIDKYFEGKIQLIDSAYETAIEVKNMLKFYNLLNPHSKQGCEKYYVSDSPESFLETGEKFLKCSIKNITEVPIHKILINNFYNN